MFPTSRCIFQFQKSKPSNNDLDLQRAIQMIIFQIFLALTDQNKGQAAAWVLIMLCKN
jgi:hypothetical protein